MGCPLLKTGKKNIKTNNAIGRNKSINHLNSETNMNIEDDCTKSEQIPFIKKYSININKKLK